MAWRTAKKAHTCEKCEGGIAPGEPYLYDRCPPWADVNSSGGWLWMKTCPRCAVRGFGANTGPDVIPDSVLDVLERLWAPDELDFLESRLVEIIDEHQDKLGDAQEDYFETASAMDNVRKHRGPTEDEAKKSRTTYGAMMQYRGVVHVLAMVGAELSTYRRRKGRQRLHLLIAERGCARREAEAEEADARSHATGEAGDGEEAAGHRSGLPAGDGGQVAPEAGPAPGSAGGDDSVRGEQGGSGLRPAAGVRGVRELQEDQETS